MNRVIIDTDPGIDDAHAILLAFAHADTQVVALTTVAGNVSVERTTANALTILDVLGKDTPVFPGCNDALVRPTLRRATSHGKDGLGDCGITPSARRPQDEHAVLALVRLAHEYPGELTLVALGPLTNIALATRLDPSLPEKFKKLVLLGGAVYAMGNSWNTAAEFNFYIDPEAAAVVFERWPSVTVVPIETSVKYTLTPEKFQRLCRIDSPRARFFQKIFARRFEQQVAEHGDCYDPDPLAMAVALEPGIVGRTENPYVQIELGGQLTRGQCVVDWTGLYGCTPNASIVMEVDAERFDELMQLSLQ